MCQRVLSLFYSLLAVPNPPASQARLHVARTHLHEDFLLALNESDVLQVFLSFSSFTTFTPVRATRDTRRTQRPCCKHVWLAACNH